MGTARIAGFAPLFIPPRARPLPASLARATPTSEARRILEGEQEPESPQEVSELLERVRQAVEERGRELKALEKQGRNPGQRIADIKDKLTRLIQRMRQAVLMGDRRSAVLMAREAAGLARELAQAVKEAAQAAREQGQPAPATAIPAVGLPAVGAPDEAAPSDSGTSVSGTSVSGTSVSGTSVSGTSDAAPSETGTPEAQARAQALAAAEAPQGGVDEGLAKEVTTALVLIKGILALAKAALGRRESRRGKDDPLARELDRAEDEIREALKDIREALQPSMEAWSPATAAAFLGATLA